MHSLAKCTSSNTLCVRFFTRAGRSNVCFWSSCLELPYSSLPENLEIQDISQISKDYTSEIGWLRCQLIETWKILTQIGNVGLHNLVNSMRILSTSAFLIQVPNISTTWLSEPTTCWFGRWNASELIYFQPSTLLIPVMLTSAPYMSWSWWAWPTLGPSNAQGLVCLKEGQRGDKREQCGWQDGKSMMKTCRSLICRSS